MSTSKPNSEIQNENVVGPGASEAVDFTTMDQMNFGNSDVEFESNVDYLKVETLESQISMKKEELRSKVYAVSMNDETFSRYEDFMKNEAEWSGTEALGIREVNKVIEKIKKDGGVKNSVIFLGALPLEASHYFLSKSKGRGLDEAEKFLSIYKALDQALSDAKNDATEIKNLEIELNAAMQGIGVE